MLKAILGVGLFGVLVLAGYPEDLVPCNGEKTMAINERISFETTGFPRTPYPNDESCTWTLTCEPEGQTQLEFITNSQGIEDSTDCTKDSLMVDDGSITKTCGTDTLSGMIFNNPATVTFTSDGSVQDKGFRYFVWCRLKPTTTPPPTTTGPTTTGPTTTPTASTTTPTASTTTPTASTTTPTASTTTPTASTTTPTASTTMSTPTEPECIADTTTPPTTTPDC